MTSRGGGATAELTSPMSPLKRSALALARAPFTWRGGLEGARRESIQAASCSTSRLAMESPEELVAALSCCGHHCALLALRHAEDGDDGCLEHSDGFPFINHPRFGFDAGDAPVKGLIRGELDLGAICHQVGAAVVRPQLW